MTLEELKADIAKRYERFIDPKDLNDALDVVKVEELIKKAQQRLSDYGHTGKLPNDGG